MLADRDEEFTDYLYELALTGKFKSLFLALSLLKSSFEVIFMIMTEVAIDMF